MTTIEDQREKSGFCFTEQQSAGMTTTIELNAILHTDDKTSKYQKIDVVDTIFGRTLITDGKTQSAQCDEYMYHETLVHPSLFLRGMLNGHSSKVKKVLIGGGGELATAREVLRHASVEKLVMVDLDEEVINVCDKHLPTWGGHGSVKADPRFELVIGDALAYLENTDDQFDVIIMDISDPIEAGPGIALYTKEFYEFVVSRLTANGVFVTQSGVCEYRLDVDVRDEGDSCFVPIHNTLNEVFDCVIPYATFIPSFMAQWGFVMAFNVNDTESSNDKKGVISRVCGMSTDTVDKCITECVTGGDAALKHYDGITHKNMFNLVKSVRTKFMKDTRIMTKENPIFMF